MRLLFIAISLIVLVFLSSCEVEPQLPYNAVVLEQIIYVDEVKQGIPQTVQMPNGKVVTYKMPMKLKDKQLLKVRDVEGEPPYYIRVMLRERDAEQKK